MPRFIIVVTAMVLLLATGCQKPGGDGGAEGSAGGSAPGSEMVKAADFVQFTDGGLVIGGGDLSGTLPSPHLKLVVDKLGTFAELDRNASGSLKLGGQPVRPADGHEFVVAEISQDQGLWTSATGENNLKGVSAVVSIGDRDVKLEKLPEVTAMSMVASVPKGAEVWLRLTDAGRTQSLNLRDGKLGRDVHPGFSRRKSGALNLEYKKAGTASSYGYTRSLEITVRASRIVLYPWTPKQGWAKDGRAWLHVSSLSGSCDCMFGDVAKGEFQAQFDLAAARSFRLVLADGSSLKPVGNDTWGTAFTNLNSDWPLAFDVPVSVTGGKLRVQPDGKVTSRWDIGVKPGRWTKRPATQDFAFTLE